MDKLQHEVMVLAYANIVVVGMAGLLFFLVICGFLDRWFGSGNTTSGPSRHQRRIQQQANQNDAFQNAVAAAVAQQVQQLQSGSQAP